MAKILVSSCLLGCDCRYKGDSCRCDAVIKLAEEHVLIGICPEQMGGLSTPRNPSEIVGDKVISCNGTDVTNEYEKGADMALKLAKLNNADIAILKANSPSCGKGVIYDGTFTGKKIEGNGITAGLFLENGIKVFTENEIDVIKKYLSHLKY